MALTSFFLGLFGFLVFAVGVLGHQGRELQRGLWRLQSGLRAGSATRAAGPSDGMDQ